MKPTPASTPPWRRAALTAGLLLVALLSVLPVLDQQAARNYETLFQRAIVTFALARTLNGVISAVQGTEVALQPAGVGVTLTPGEILDPINDLVERFSWIMLGATVSLGVQNVLMDISAWWVMQALVVVLALWLVAALWRGRDGGGRQLLTRALMIAVFLRFAVPLTLVLNEAIYELFLESRYVESTEVIQAAGEEIEALGEASMEEAEGAPGAGDETGLLGSMLGPLREAWNEAAAGASLGERVAAIQARAGAVIEHLIQLSVVFILQTGIVPLVFLWLFLQLARWLFRPLGNPTK